MDMTIESWIAIMLAGFFAVGVAGIAAGLFFRAGVLALASFALLVFAAVALHERSTPSAIVLCVALLATMQFGYIAGLFISNFTKKAVRHSWRLLIFHSRPNTLNQKKDYAEECPPRPETKQTA